jgi:peptide deformylase
MIIKSVTQVGNPIIRKKSKKVVSVKFPKIKKIIKDLTDSMRHANLVGMAAPQIGQNFRIFVSEIRTTTLRKTKELDKLRVFINPKIINKSRKTVSGYEGCGSVASAGIFGKVPRSVKVTVTAFDENNKKFVLTTKGLLARVIQHELDHLDGIIFLDKVSDKKSLMSQEEYIKRGKKK